MKFQFFIGIDMGKTSFDFCIMDENRAIIDRGVVDNEPASISVWIKALPRRFDGVDFWGKRPVLPRTYGLLRAAFVEHARRANRHETLARKSASNQAEHGHEARQKRRDGCQKHIRIFA